VSVSSYTLAWDGEWHLDLPALRAAVTPRTRAVVIVNPNNPTGMFLKTDERRAIEELCAECSLALVSDEVFADFAFREDARRAASVAHDGPALAFALGGLSKSCALPQLKLAWTAVTGPERLVAEALARLEVIADSYLSVSTPVQVAAPELLARREALQAPILARARANLARLRSLAAGSAASLLEPEGGWYAVLRVPSTLGEDERVTRLLDERNVLVHPGYFFDFPHEAFLVLSLLTPEDDFAQGVSLVFADLAA
jgi:aspartate/methionine/tyrosine aminotransferase